jgi:prepilin-type N-terminal cleavage/methylation domain-containing protein/prepilin-type processing-associated H-X9-DG protein
MKKGFTLIELLVVIAIITLLTSISIPGLREARLYSQKTVCQSNLRQWGLILEMYTDVNNSLFFEGVLGSHWDDWIEILQSYYGKKGKITFCPLAQKNADEGGLGVYAAWKDVEGSDFGSYGLNGWVCNAGSTSPLNELFWRTPCIKDAQDVPVFLDCLWMVNWPDANSVPPDFDGQPLQAWNQEEQMKNFCINRHGKGATNCLFMDWSVKSVGLKQLWKLNWHKSFDVNGPWTKSHNPIWPEWMRKFKDY